MSSGQGRPVPPTRRSDRRSRRRGLAAVAGIVAATALVGGGCYAFAGSLGCVTRGALELNVTVAPELAPAIKAAADRFNGQRHVTGGRCVEAVVRSADPQAVATLLSGSGSSRDAGSIPDVWIPDSSLWANLTPGDGSDGSPAAVRMPQPGFSIAETPIVAAVPRSVRGVGATAPPSWERLLTSGGSKARMPDPGRHAVGLGTLIVIRSVLAGDRDATAKFTGIVRGLRESVVPDVRAQFARGVGDRVLITSEQAVLGHNRDRPAERLQVVRPAEGTVVLDYPYTLVADDEDRSAAARLFEREVRGGQTRQSLRALGLRTTGGTEAAGMGLLPVPKAEDVRQALQAWAKLSLTTRMLSLIDVSGSMIERVPGTRATRLQVLAQASQMGLALQPDDTELGQWVFSTNLDGRRDWRENVPLGPLGERIGSVTRRQRILSALSSLRPKPDGDTALYATVLAAFTHMRETYKPDMVNTVLLMTDGRNDDPDGPTLSRTLAQLRKEYDPDRPVQVVIIGFGDEVDRNELEQLARATHGSVHIAHTPADMKKIFLAGTARRVCSPRC
ncbi:von Willebrand factor type A domain-containing protein [Thermomonospora echinospora]|uniref:von Willebrand factor type A domain-containing protein n=1 Tax=Thermomonospora echinospora TaxID=1992 RepID=A0A1H6CAA8_9ACTN|nr:substrate-binding and VWA domain-containing protein [Thermomonospora echinospora]SEG69697.1 von Willebrand factor type A domain-containing protein [Thermomonospora echinospora]